MCWNSWVDCDGNNTINTMFEIFVLVRFYQDARIGLHWISATTWSTRGAYDLTCSTWVTDTCQFWLSISSRISFSLLETEAAHSFHSSLWTDLSKFNFSTLFVFDFIGKTRGTSFLCSAIMFWQGSFSPLQILLFGCEDSGWWLVTLPCTCINPPTSFLRAWHAVTHPSSELGMRPMLILSATLRGHVWNNSSVNHSIRGMNEYFWFFHKQVYFEIWINNFQE